LRNDELIVVEPPFILDPPLDGQKAAEGQTINLTCSVYGSPKPLVVWKKGYEQLTGGRYLVMDNGDLQITVSHPTPFSIIYTFSLAFRSIYLWI